MASDRIKGFAEHMAKGGVKPIVITRNWNENQTTLTDKVMNNEYKHEVYESHEVHRMPYKQTLRDKLATKKSLRVVQRLLTLKEIFLSHFFIRSLPYSNLYDKADQLISSDPEIKAVIVSGTPFISFQIGYKLKKKHPNILWIPDYRDEWTTRPTKNNTGLIWRLISKLDIRSELKWSSNADGFLSVSEIWKNRIEELTKKPGIVIRNGFEDYATEIPRNSSDEINILYIGTLYPYQPWSDFIASIKELPEPLFSKIQLTIIGSYASEPGVEKVEKIISDFIETNPRSIKFIDRIPKAELKQFIADADFGLLLPYKNLDGCIPVKLYDYTSAFLPSLLYKSNKSLMEDFILSSNSGFIVNSFNELQNLFESSLKEEINSKLKFDQNELNQYTRSYQAKKLSEEILKKWKETNSLE